MYFLDEEIANLCPVKIGDIYCVYDRFSGYSDFVVTEIFYKACTNEPDDIYRTWKARLKNADGKCIDCDVTKSGELYFDSSHAIRSRVSMIELQGYIWRVLNFMKTNPTWFATVPATFNFGNSDYILTNYRLWNPKVVIEVPKQVIKIFRNGELIIKKEVTLSEISKKTGVELYREIVKRDRESLYFRKEVASGSH